MNFCKCGENFILLPLVKGNLKLQHSKVGKMWRFFADMVDFCRPSHIFCGKQNHQLANCTSYNVYTYIIVDTKFVINTIVVQYHDTGHG